MSSIINNVIKYMNANGLKVFTIHGVKPTFFMKFMQKIASSSIFSDKLKIELYPPFFLMRVKVISIENCWRQVRIKLPLNTFSRNPGGVMFGGYQACLADPIAALACAKVFPGYSVWTRAMKIDFQHGGATDLELKFDFNQQLEDTIRDELNKYGKSTPTFTYGYYLSDGSICTQVHNTVAIRPKGYIKATSPPADGTEFGNCPIDKK